VTVLVWDDDQNAIDIVQRCKVYGRRDRIEIDTDRAGHKNAFAIGGVADRSRYRHILDSVSGDERINNEQRLQPNKSWVGEKFASSPPFSSESIDWMRLTTPAPIVQNLLDNIAKRLDGGQVRVHDSKRALVIGANTYIEALVGASPSDACDFETAALAHDHAALDHHIDLINIEECCDFWLYRRSFDK